MIKENIEEYKIYNSNMTLYFLNSYSRFQEVPRELTDVNIISDYGKIEGFMNLCKEQRKNEILEKIVAGEPIDSEITEKFNADISFGETELISLLFYLGYLTIGGVGFSKVKMVSPNDVIREIYSKYFLTYLSKSADINLDRLDTEKMNEEILIHGKIDTIMETLGQYLTNLSNRDYARFDEKYVKIIFYSLSRILGTMVVKSELEVGGKYSNILLIPREKIEERYGILLEFKYIKKEEYEQENNILKQKQEEAKEQLEKYKKTEEIKMIQNLKTYSIVAIKDELYIEEV